MAGGLPTAHTSKSGADPDGYDGLIGHYKHAYVPLVTRINVRVNVI